MHLILKWLLAASSIALATYIVPGIKVDAFYAALVAAFVLGVLSITVKPILKILTLPVTMLTLGLSSLAINAGLFWFTGSVVKGFYVEGFTAAFFGSVILSVANFLGDKILSKDDDIL